MKSDEKYNSIKHKMKFFATILSWTLFVLLILIAIVLVYYFITTRIMAKKDTSYRPAFVLYTIISPSMEKTLNIYDVIVNVKVKDENSIKVGDIITFISTSTSSKGMTVTHRVIEIKEDENGNKLFKTKGDNNTSPDPKPATFDNIIGKVLFKIPQLGRLQSILVTKTGWLILVVVPAFIIILYDILKLLRIHGAEKSIEEITSIDNKKKEQEEETKKKIAVKLTNKYKQKREFECDPLKKSSVIIEVNDEKQKYNEVLSSLEIPKDNVSDDSIISDDIITKEELINEYAKDKKSEKTNNTHVNTNNINKDNKNKDKNDNITANKDNSSNKDSKPDDSANNSIKEQNNIEPVKKKVRTRKKKKNKNKKN